MNALDLGTRFLAATPTHEHRTPEQLRAWARIAFEYGDELAAEHPELPQLDIREKTGGKRPGEILLAEYHHRDHRVTLYRDSLDFARQVSAKRGHPIPADRLRRAAIAHEVGHHLLHGVRTRELNRRLGHRVLRLRAHVAGADELVVHRYAQHLSGIDPLLLNNFLVSAMDAPSARSRRSLD
ncbi:hypothetical protein [Amycolatopsis albispora]|uniref:Uncharacterized protein n=1 Tax=Amycolatopsis albispora TaxID=1804986 RepID=A0A344LFY9_9PSEU|nr:hypothetical protein [Amycolatopsis albispora]AXB46963.1 hypothetical protein A4R43_34705 [Amycolatopsis albispora]